MKIRPIQTSDIEFLNEIQPPEWGDIKPHIKNYVDSFYCDPLKVTEKDKIIGIGTTVRHRDTVWLAHIIVHPEFRNKGIGKKITDALVKSVDRRKYRTIYLIATELGYPVYLKSGFELEAEYAHFEIENKKFDFTSCPFIIPFKEKYRTEILNLDKFTSGENRDVRLNEVMQSSFVFLSDKKVTGVFFPSLGDGLIIAADPDAGTELMKFRMQTKDNAIFPFENKNALEFFSQNGFKNHMMSKRMRLGRKRIWHPENLYNRVSGQIG